MHCAQGSAKNTRHGPAARFAARARPRDRGRLQGRLQGRGWQTVDGRASRAVHDERRQRARWYVGG